MEPDMGSPEATGHAERRTKWRFALEQEVSFRTLPLYGMSQTGQGRTLNISSRGVAVQSKTSNPVGTSMELSMPWPVALDGGCRLKLTVFGRVIRTEPEQFVLSIDRYEFRTQARDGGRVTLAGDSLVNLGREIRTRMSAAL